MIPVLALSLGLSCRSDTVDPVRHNLVAMFAGAEALVETHRVDFGTRDSSPFLLSGWSFDEVAGDGSTFVWSLGAASEVGFYIVERRPIDLEMRAWPLIAPGLPEQRVTVAVNGETISAIALGIEPGSYRLAIPSSRLQPGWNSLRFEPSVVGVPAELMVSSDTRQLGVAVDWLQFRRQAVADPRVDPARDRIVLARGGSLEYYFDLEPGSTFTLEALMSEPSEAQSDLRLEVSTAIEGTPERDSLLLPASPRPVRVSFDPAGGLARLILSVVGAEPSSAGGTMSLVAPRIRSPAVRFAAESPRPPRPDSLTRPHVVLYVIDALRADRLGCYGNPRGLTPTIDRFAERSILFESAHAQSSWTKPAMASVLTGLHPWKHGANTKDEPLPEAPPTLAGLFRRHGYRTAAVVGNAFVSETFGFDRDFESFEYLRRSGDLPDKILERTGAWLETADTAPLFLYVHTIEPHAPYAAPDRWRERFAGAVARTELGELERVTRLSEDPTPPARAVLEDLEALYDAEVAHADERFASFLDKLEAAGLGNNTVIILTSDHGEAFYEHGTLTHGKDLFEEVLRIPLIVHIPGRAGERRAARVQQVDLFPTLETLLLGGSGASPVDGRDLLRNPAAARRVFSYLSYSPERRSASVIEGRWKLILPVERSGMPELFDLSGDPGETRSLARSKDIRSGYLRSLLRLEMTGLRRSDPVSIDQETREELEALGYLR